MMKSYVLETTVVSIKEHIPVLGASKGADGQANTIYGPKQWKVLLRDCFAVSMKTEPVGVSAGDSVTVTVNFHREK